MWEHYLDFILSGIDDGEKECEIIDIANREMEKIDSSEIDSEYKKVFTKEITKNLINRVYFDDWQIKDITSYMERIGDSDIFDIRVADKNIYFKTTKNIVPITLANMIGIDEEYIETVPIFGKYSFYFIDTTKCVQKCAVDKSPLNVYNPKNLVSEIMTIAQNPERDVSTIRNIIEDGLYENWEDYIDTYFTVEIEDQVIAIAFDRYISDAKQVFGEVFSINPKLFIEVSTPFQTVLLIDSCRWDLDPNFGGEQWYL